VAVAVGRPGINAMLVASQVALSIVLPFIILPLVWLTSSRTVMRVSAPARPPPARKEDGTEEPNVAGDEYLDFSNGWFLAGVGYIILAIIVVANAYVLVILMIGKGN